MEGSSLDNICCSSFLTSCVIYMYTAVYNMILSVGLSFYCTCTVSLPKPIYILQWMVAIATGPSSLSVATPVGVGYSSEAGTVITPSHSMEAKLVPDLEQLMRPGPVTPSTVQVSNSNRVKMGQKQF